jgi:hypothetical protein
MPQSFDNLAEVLEKLLEGAREAVLGGKDNLMKASHRALGDFIAESDDRIPGVIELDNVASNAMRDVTLARLDQSLVKNLSDRSAEVAALVKAFTKQAAINSSEAAKVRLERVKAVLDAGTTVVAELRKLIDTVDTSNPDGKKLAKAITDAVDAVQDVHKSLTGLG